MSKVRLEVIDEALEHVRQYREIYFGHDIEASRRGYPRCSTCGAVIRTTVNWRNCQPVCDKCK